jgi:hypothetical protein
MRIRALVTNVMLLAAAVFLSACASSDDGALRRFMSGEDLVRERPDDLSADFFRKQTYCPPVQIRGGAETYIIYERGHDAEPSFVQHQAAISKTARECTPTLEGLSVKLGIAGRVVSGPKGGPANLTMPVRIVVSRQTGGVLYSELYKVPAAIVPPNLAGEFSQVFQAIAVSIGPDDRDLIIYVGFDEGKAG